MPIEKAQIWIAECVYALVAIWKRSLALDPDLYTIPKILSIGLFEKTPIQILQILTDQRPEAQGIGPYTCLNLFSF